MKGYEKRIFIALTIRRNIQEHKHIIKLFYIGYFSHLKWSNFLKALLRLEGFFAQQYEEHGSISDIYVTGGSYNERNEIT
ncbi:MAG: hypothetical protein FWD05_13880 [Oscillospiraceae bacterium]|nr:hypothetical protein [Oscillospiraceae bacterium]